MSWTGHLLELRQCMCSLKAVPSYCGVCDAARYYITMDILRRVLESHFQYHIMFVMNVTDIDDKIIKRARLKHLLSEHLQQTPDDSKASVGIPIDDCCARQLAVECCHVSSIASCSANPCIMLATGCNRSSVLGEERLRRLDARFGGGDSSREHSQQQWRSEEA